LHSDVQLGPLALAIAEVLRIVAGPHTAPTVAVVLFSAAVIPAIYAVERLTGASPFFVLGGGALVVVTWTQASAHNQFADNVVSLFVLAAVYAIARDRWCPAALFVFLAIVTKPWAFPMLLMLLGLRRGRWRALAVATFAVGVATLPFVIGVHGTHSAIVPPTAPGTGAFLQLVDVVHWRPWVRPGQFVIGFALACVALRRGSWTAVPAVVVLARIALDPQTLPYVLAGPVFFVFLFEAGCVSRPIGTVLVSALLLPLPPIPRLALIAGTTAYVLVAAGKERQPLRPSWRSGTGRRSVRSGREAGAKPGGRARTG
jgi:hypothetical protein